MFALPPWHDYIQGLNLKDGVNGVGILNKTGFFERRMPKLPLSWIVVREITTFVGSMTISN